MKFINSRVETQSNLACMCLNWLPEAKRFIIRDLRAEIRPVITCLRVPFAYVSFLIKYRIAKYYSTTAIHCLTANKKDNLIELFI